MQEAAGGKVDPFAAAVSGFYSGCDSKRDLRGVDNGFNVGPEARFLFRHVAVFLEPGWIPCFAVLFPFPVLDFKAVDFFLLFPVIIINSVEGVAAEIHLNGMRVHFQTGVAPIGGAVPALQLITQEQQKSQREGFHTERLFADCGILAVIKSDGHFVQTVVQQDRCQRVQMLLFEGGKPDRCTGHFPVKTDSAEVSMVDMIGKFLR